MKEFIREKAVNLVRKVSGNEVLDKVVVDELADKIYGVDKFDKDANRRQGRLDILNYFDSLELRPELLTNKKVLDIGSSTTFFDEYCRKKYSAQVVCADISKKNLGVNHPLGVVGDARQLPFKDECFDLVISCVSVPGVFTPYRDVFSGEVIPIEGSVREETLRDILDALHEAYRVTKAGGQVRMSSFSKSALLHNDAYRFSEKTIHDLNVHMSINGKEDINQKLDRVYIIQEALETFEQQTGAKCMFKDKKSGGLIIILK